ncbi:hypothetical protein BpHYR1_033950 [Brachionus plicatilis]|uniref:RNA-directed DNA polymerase from mobile element jockey-like n=1 Tax=Brachionus plicatilis TaxID=10195 RepID=A0A3M7S1M5_BRAPC|nr:hypothetical protein BpHYR1_033950 [Brachionus plicatilis]
MIKYNQIPHLVSVGKILPILKKKESQNNDINTIRPITISDTITNILNPQTQFGFKSEKQWVRQTMGFLH